MLNLSLFLEILLVSSLFSILFGLFLLAGGVVLDPLPTQLFLLLSHLLDPIDPGLLLKAVLEGDLVSPIVQDACLAWLTWLHRRSLLHETCRSVGVVAGKEGSSDLACLRICAIDCVDDACLASWRLG